MASWRDIVRSDPDRELKEKRFKKSARNKGLRSNTYGAASGVRSIQPPLEKCKAESEEICRALYCPKARRRLAYCPWEKNQ